MTAGQASGAGDVGQQVAALCWRCAPRLEILLVTSLHRRRWILPKGWPEPGMTLAEAAAKEALEEAGVIGQIAAQPVGRYHYRKQRKDGTLLSCAVEVFPLRVKGQRRAWAERGARDLVWLSAADAAARVSEPELRDILIAFGKSQAAAGKTRAVGT